MLNLTLSKFSVQIDAFRLVGFSRIRIWIVRVEGEHTYHFTTTTTAQEMQRNFLMKTNKKNYVTFKYQIHCGSM